MLPKKPLNSFGLEPQQHQCMKGVHTLTWKSGGGTCASCKKQGCRSRYQCLPCAEIYCLSCMPPPLYGIICGAGHEYLNLLQRMNEAEVPFHVCDNCSATIQQVAHRCAICDFDICPNCLIVKED